MALIKFPSTIPSTNKPTNPSNNNINNPNKTKSQQINFAIFAASANGSRRAEGSAGLQVAYQGVPGAYSEFAAKTACPDCITLPCRAFSDTVSAVVRGRADRAILPVESTMEGTTLRNYDLLLRHDLNIVQEINLFVNYCLLAMPGVSPGEVKRVISHPMALAHCGRALARLGVSGEAVEDTAGAVEMLRSHSLRDTAAIASPRAALLYGLHVLEHGFQDESWNVTRFLILSRFSDSSMPQPIHVNGDRKAVKVNGHKSSTSTSSVMKTSIVVAHRGGSMMVLLKVLNAFSARNINLTKLEVKNPAMDGDGEGPVMILDVRVRPGKLTAFPHVLYVDFEGSADDPNVKDAINEIAAFSVFVRILGCYPADSNVYDLHDG